MNMKHISVSDEAKAKMTAIKGGVMAQTETEDVTYSDIIVAAIDAVGESDMVRALVEDKRRVVDI
jgi:predicted CopG family antitoxin